MFDANFSLHILHNPERHRHFSADSCKRSRQHDLTQPTSSQVSRSMTSSSSRSSWVKSATSVIRNRPVWLEHSNRRGSWSATSFSSLVAIQRKSVEMIDCPLDLKYELIFICFYGCTSCHWRMELSLPKPPRRQLVPVLPSQSACPAQKANQLQLFPSPSRLHCSPVRNRNTHKYTEKNITKYIVMINKLMNYWSKVWNNYFFFFIEISYAHLLSDLVLKKHLLLSMLKTVFQHDALPCLP